MKAFMIQACVGDDSRLPHIFTQTENYTLYPPTGTQGR